MGSRITNVDCAAFGILAQVRWATPDQCPGKTLLISKLIVLLIRTRYAYRLMTNMCNFYLHIDRRYRLLLENIIGHQYQNEKGLVDLRRSNCIRRSKCISTHMDFMFISIVSVFYKFNENKIFFYYCSS